MNTATTTTAKRTPARYLVLLFAGYCLLYGGVSYLTNRFILTDSLIQQEWSQTFASSHVEMMLDQRHRWTLLGYALLPLVLSIKILYAGFCLVAAGVLLAWDVAFRDVIETTLQAEVVFVLAAIIHFSWGLFGAEINSVADYTVSYPLSALALVTLDSSQHWMAYALKTINVFEIGYIAMLGWGLRRLTMEPKWRIIAVVASGYGTGVLLLICAVTFLSLFVL